MYCIKSLCPTDRGVGGHYFAIDLMPEFRERVARCELDQAAVDRKLRMLVPTWLQACGYDSRVLVPTVRVEWGPWGPHHICVPGNACGLDIVDSDGGFGCWFPGGVTLQPHNIDHWQQKQLLLIVFTSFAEDVILLGRPETNWTKRRAVLSVEPQQGDKPETGE